MSDDEFRGLRLLSWKKAVQRLFSLSKIKLQAPQAASHILVRLRKLGLVYSHAHPAIGIHPFLVWVFCSDSFVYKSRGVFFVLASFWDFRAITHAPGCHVLSTLYSRNFPLANHFALSIWTAIVSLDPKMAVLLCKTAGALTSLPSFVVIIPVMRYKQKQNLPETQTRRQSGECSIFI